MDKHKIAQDVKSIIESVLPNTFNIIVQERKSFYGDGYFLAIGTSPSKYEISGVRGQFPQLVSLRLRLEELELESSHFGGMGGGSFHRSIRPDLFPIEKYHALGSVKVPFRKPKKDLDSIYRAIKRFFERYLALLIKWGEDLRYKDKGDYSFIEAGLVKQREKNESK